MTNLEKFIETLPENEQELFFNDVDAWKSALEREKCHASFMDYIRTMWPGFVAAIQMAITVVNVEFKLTTAGGRIVCRRCNAMYRR